MEVLNQYPGLEVLEAQYTSWSPANGKKIMFALIQKCGDGIDGVWADSGLQGSGSIEAFLAAGHEAGTIPPHTGGDFNAMYQLSVTHDVPMIGIDYPPAMIDRRALKVNAAALLANPGIALNPDDLVESLSVADKQMVEIAKALRAKAKVLILDVPTRWIDVGAKSETCKTLRELAAERLAILVISSELMEVVGLCDRVCVIRGGEIAKVLFGGEITKAAIMTVAAAETASHHGVAK